MFDDFDKVIQPYLAIGELPDEPKNEDYHKKLNIANDILKESAFPLYKRYNQLQCIINKMEKILGKPDLEKLVGEEKISISDEISGLMSEVGDCYNEIYKLYRPPEKGNATFERAMASAKIAKFYGDVYKEEKELRKRLTSVSKKVYELQERGWDIRDYTIFFMRMNSEYEKKVGKVIEILN
jgi:hypothetical protein